MKIVKGFLSVTKHDETRVFHAITTLFEQYRRTWHHGQSNDHVIALHNLMAAASIISSCGTVDITILHSARTCCQLVSAKDHDRLSVKSKNMLFSIIHLYDSFFIEYDAYLSTFPEDLRNEYSYSFTKY